MKNLLIRTVSGIIYVALILGSVLISKLTFVFAFGLFLSYTLYEFYRLCKKGGNQPQTLLGIFIALYLFISFFLYDTQVIDERIFFALIPLLILSPVVELFRNNKTPVQNIAYTLMGVIYIGIPFSVLNFIITPYDNSPDLFTPKVLLGLFVILWANDSGAYLFGSWLGKTKMIERVSPKKSWEGAFGGAFIAVIASLLFFSLFKFVSLPHAIVLTIITVIAGTFGDLTESMIKRGFDVKDSGNLMPGHGGLLDRFDSMLFAAPAYYIYISVILN